MQIDAVQLLVQAGALGLFAFFLWKMFGPMLNRVMDNLDQQTKNYQESILVQAKVATALDAVVKRLDDCEEAHGERADVQDKRQAEIQGTQEEITGVLRGINQQFQTHEVRAAARHEQQMKESHERHAEMLKAFQDLNGHS